MAKFIQDINGNLVNLDHVVTIYLTHNKKFIIADMDTGGEITLMDGMVDPDQFFYEHYTKPLTGV